MKAGARWGFSPNTPRHRHSWERLVLGMVGVPPAADRSEAPVNENAGETQAFPGALPSTCPHTPGLSLRPHLLLRYALAWYVVHTRLEHYPIEIGMIALGRVRIASAGPAGSGENPGATLTELARWPCETGAIVHLPVSPGADRSLRSMRCTTRLLPRRAGRGASADPARAS